MFVCFHGSMRCQSHTVQIADTSSYFYGGFWFFIGQNQGWG